MAKKPSWLKVRLPGSPRYHAIKEQARALDLATVCEEARCPNIGECWGSGTATFMVMGDTCTRGCRFCSVKTMRNPPPLDPNEPDHVASAIESMKLDYVVLTSVDRDDVADQGAGHFAACIAAIRRRSPATMVEVLIPDFQGDASLLIPILAAGPEVVAHNVETVERLTPRIRDPRASYHQSLRMLAAIKTQHSTMFSKSSLMVGLGETEAEMIRSMRDLRDVGCDFLTIGQYLQPSKKHQVVEEFVHPDVFARYEAAGLEMGFSYVASGPLVRSSYRAGEFYIRRAIQARASA